MMTEYYLTKKRFSKPKTNHKNHREHKNLVPRPRDCGKLQVIAVKGGSSHTLLQCLTGGGRELKLKASDTELWGCTSDQFKTNKDLPEL